MPFDGAFSPLHWLIVGVIALLVLGPDQLPKLAREAGRLYHDFARMRQHLSSELRDMVSEFDLAAAQQPTPSTEADAIPAPVDGTSSTPPEEAPQ
jgi:TatA/E family protein of Tat protein translocase